MTDEICSEKCLILTCVEDGCPRVWLDEDIERQEEEAKEAEVGQEDDPSASGDPGLTGAAAAGLGHG